MSNDDLGLLVGAGVTLTLDGQEYVIDSFGLEDWENARNHLLRQKQQTHIRVITDMREAFAPDEYEREKAKAIKEARGLTVSLEEVINWADTIEGAVYTVWLMLEKRYPGKWTLTKLKDHLTKMFYDSHAEYQQLMEARDKAAATEKDDEGNSPGSPSGASKPTPSPTCESSPAESPAGSNTGAKESCS